MYCTECGVRALEQSKFCTDCGYPLSRANNAALIAHAATKAPAATSRFYTTDSASFPHRALGYGIDVVISLAAGSLLFVVYQAILSDTRFGLTMFVTGVFYAHKWIADSRGGTVGKLIVGVRVVDDSTLRPIGLVNGFIRTIFAFFSGLVFGLGYLWAAWDRERKTWHDHAVNSSVIKKRG
jgi:uncharacterized RDD family membrane protein YckC